MSVHSHTLKTAFDSLEQCVAVTIPADTLAECLVPTADHFDRLKSSVEDADIVRTGIEEMSKSVRIATHDESVAMLAKNLGGVEITLTAKALLELAHELLAQAVDHSIIGRTAIADLTAARNLVERVQGDEARSASIHDRSIRRIPRQVAVMPGRVA
jgi:hypothetical protein